ncbi:FHA domain-containing protein [Haliangium sp.]|uniref:FHA domain-containing protein n=1 Tax=Haliangium sp. TaxID=2663208 RepID=UPI003D0AA942
MSFLRRRLGRRSSPGKGTVTWKLRHDISQATDTPVHALRWLPGGPTFLLDDYVFEGRPRKWLTVGSDEDRDIVVQPRGEDEEGTVSSLHCLLCRDRKTQRLYVLDADSKNGTFVNGTMIMDGMLELTCGSLLRVGPEVLMARGDGDHKAAVSGATLAEFLRNAETVHGSKRAAAEALNVPWSTYQRWLQSEKFDE